jgi:hypothetical protein
MFDIRFDRVEEIVNAFLAKYNFFNIDGTKTTSTVSDLMYYETRIDNDEDINHFIQLHMCNIKMKVMDYFTKYNTMNNANNHLKNQILTDESGLYHIERCLMQSLTLMKLCNDIDFEWLSQKYKEIYVSWGGYEEKGLEAINDLIECLYKL